VKFGEATGRRSLDAAFSCVSMNISAHAGHSRNGYVTCLDTPSGGRRTLVIQRGPCQGVHQGDHVFLFAHDFRDDPTRLKCREVPSERRSARLLLGSRRNFLYAPGRLAFIGSRCPCGFMGGFARVLSELWDTKYRAGDDLHQVWLQLERSRRAEVQGDDVDESATADGAGCTTTGPIACSTAAADGRLWRGRSLPTRCSADAHGSRADAGIRRWSGSGRYGRRSASRRPRTHRSSRSHACASRAAGISAAWRSASVFRAKPGFGKYGRV